MKAVWIGVALLAVLAAMWGYATYDLGARTHAYHKAVEEMRFIERSGSIMSEDAIVGRLEALGPETKVQVLEANVWIEDLDDSNIEDAPTPTQMVADAADEAGSMSVTGTLIQIDVEIEASKWLWDTKERVELRRTVGQQLVMER